MNLTTLLTGTLLASLSFAAAQSAEYTLDPAHSFIDFRVKHLGYSWLPGRFDSFTGGFTFDENAPENSSVQIEIDTASVNSNHAERDNHLRSADFLDVDGFPTASFVSTSMVVTDKTAVVTGDLTFHGVTREITLDAELVGFGDDPWGGFRAGFVGTTSFTMSDFGMVFNLGPASSDVELTLSIEGIRK